MTLLLSIGFHPHFFPLIFDFFQLPVLHHSAAPRTFPFRNHLSLILPSSFPHDIQYIMLRISNTAVKIYQALNNDSQEDIYSVLQLRMLSMTPFELPARKPSQQVFRIILCFFFFFPCSYI